VRPSSLVYASLALIAAGCGNDFDVHQSCRQLWTKVCTARQKCQPGAFSDWHHGDLATCVQQMSQLCAENAMATGAKPTQAGFDACVAAIDPADCDGYWLSLAGVRVTAACEGKGLLADGTACSGGQQCQSGYCSTLPALYCGSCAARPAGAAGAACNLNQDCGIGLACINHACTAFGTLNASCSDAAPCQPSLACVNGACVARIAVGGDCKDKGNACFGDAVCFNNTCTGFTPVILGSPCGLLPGGPINCGKGLKCKADAGTSPSQPTGVCVAEVPAGGDCHGGYVFSGEPCASPTVCIDGTCQDPAVHAALCTAVPALTPRATTCGPANPAQTSVLLQNNSMKDASLFMIDPNCAEQAIGLVPVGYAAPFQVGVGQLLRFRDPVTAAIVKEVTVAANQTIALP
jgi:hypothetical protein